MDSSLLQNMSAHGEIVEKRWHVFLNSSRYNAIDEQSSLTRQFKVLIAAIEC